MAKKARAIAPPADLAAAIKSIPGLEVMWQRLRPSCRRDYAARVRAAKDIETRARRIIRVVELTVEYWHRHRPKGKHGAAGRRPRASVQRSGIV